MLVLVLCHRKSRLLQTIALPARAVALLLDHLSVALDRRRLRGMERLCLEQAEKAGAPEGRAALKEMALNYRAAALTGAESSAWASGRPSNR